MAFWSSSPVPESPTVALSDWCVYQIHAGTQHLVGRNDDDNDYGHVSSAIESVNYPPLHAHSRSGRISELRTPGGLHPDASYTWYQWCLLNRVSWYVDVSSEYLCGARHDDA
ncbi:hypothetical protein PTKU46_57990 [Paraburkholderia terrae]|uniref:hypothetical protein n=1 Tax=Paraburkholderia terrae TaxID=311230 RepID=UPI0030E5C1D2